MACWKQSALAQGHDIALEIVDIDNKLNVEYNRPAPAFVGLVFIEAGCMTSEAVRFITGIQPPILTNNVKKFNFDDFSITTHERWQRLAGCSVCGIKGK